jgi:flagellar hook protein FlgE
MLQAMYNGVSGLDTQQTWMDTIGNNIANANTTGYKAATVSFEDQLSQMIQGPSGSGQNVGGTDPIQEGLGVKLAAIGTNTSQGGLESTSVPTDMAISGNGYFMVGNGASVSYTRDGTFALDNSGNLVDSNGNFVLGWTANGAGAINTTGSVTAASHLQIPVGTMTATSPTQNVTYAGNLSADTVPGSATSYTRAVNVYDSKGASQTVTLAFTNAATAAAPTPTPAATGGTLPAGTYDVAYSYVYANGSESAPSATSTVTTSGATGSIALAGITAPAGATGVNVYIGSSASTMQLATATPLVPGAGGATTGTITTPPAVGAAAPPASDTWDWTASGGGSSGSGTINFGGTGTELSATGNITLVNADGSTTPQTIAPSFTGVTSLSGVSNAAPTTQDGSGPGTLQSFSVDDTGTITGVFSNGLTRSLGQIALSSFANPAGLAQQGNNDLALTPDSGTATIGVANTSGLGTINTGFLEQSNVDLSTEFTNMIVAQRGYQANTEIVSTVDQLLSDVLSMVTNG